MGKTIHLLGVVLLLVISERAVNRLMAQGATATILGTVSDVSGAAIPEASVRVTNVQTGVTQSAATDTQGRFRLPDLPVGEYKVQTAKMGFLHCSPQRH
jgi:hypothetical protein